MASVFFGGAISLSGSEIDYEAPWGTASSVSILEGAVSYGGQYLYALNPYLAVGAEFNANNFESTTDRIWGAGYAAETITSKMDVYSILPAGRLTVNPAHAFRLYVPLGRGGSRGQKSMTAHTAGVSASGSETDCSVIYYAGLGIEGDLMNNWTLGAEMRYSRFTMDTRKLVQHGGKENFSFLALMLKLSYRF